MEALFAKVFTNYEDGGTLVDLDWPHPWPVNCAQADVLLRIETEELEQAIVSIPAKEFTKEYAEHNRKRLEAKSIRQLPLSLLISRGRSSGTMPDSKSPDTVAWYPVLRATQWNGSLSCPTATTQVCGKNAKYYAV